MEAIVSAVKSTQSIDVKDNIKQVCKTIAHLKDGGNESQVKDFLQTVGFESAFEKLVAIKLIDAFKLNDNLISAFSTEDLFVISQSLKCDWFFEDEAGVLANRESVVNFFSKLSYSGRCKVIRKYSKKLKDTGKAESIFGLLDEIYGLGTALEILAACSESFITDILYSKHVTLPSHIVKQLYQKYPDFTVDFLFSYFEKRKKSKAGDCRETYESTIIKMASENTPMFIEFYNKYGDSFYLGYFGRSLTRKVIKSGYSSILRNIDAYMKILNVKLVVPYLTLAQIEELHFHLLPKTVVKFRESWAYYTKEKHIELLDHVKPSFNKTLLLKNFKKKYGKDPMDVKLGENIVEVFPVEMRTKWAEKELENQDLSDTDKANFAAYLPFDRAFETLKLMMPTALDVNTRSHVIGCMMKSVKVNKHVAGVTQVVSFVTAKHRNDLKQVKGRPLDDLRDDIDLVSLTVDQWAPIIELFNIMIINNEIDSYTNELVSAYQQYIHRKLIENSPIDNEMTILLKHINYYFDFVLAKGTKYEGVCLRWFNDNLHKKDFANEREKKNFAVKLFCTINHFNSHHSDSSIPHKDWIVEIVKEKLQESYSRDEIIKSLKKNKELKKELYDSIFPTAIFPEVLQYKLNNNVIDIQNNIKYILRKVMDTGRVYTYKSFFRSLLLFIDLPDKFIDQCLKEIEWEDDDNGVRQKENGIIILSFLGNPERFLRFIESYYPDGMEAECEGSDAYEKYRLQSAIAASLKNINPPYKALEAVKRFSKGDYLKLVLGSVLSVSLKISQNKALAFINENLDTPVSYRKHIIRVFKMVGSKSDVNKMLISSIQSEKNVSIRVLLLNGILDLIKNEKTQLSWDTVKQAMILLTENDLKQLERRIYSLREIPVEYQAEYIETVWATLSRLNVSNAMKTKIYSLIDDTSMLLISNDFADFLLSMTYSFEPKEDEQSHDSTWNSYISLYLIYSKPEGLEDRMNKFMQLIKNKLVSLNELNSTERMYYLIMEICNGSLAADVKINPMKLLSDLQTRLLKIFPEYEIYKISLTLSLHKIFMKNNKGESIVAFADEVCGLVDLHCSTYGPQLIHILSKHVKQFVASNFHNKNQNCMLIFSNRLITGPTSPNNKILGVISLPSSNDLELDNELKLHKLTMEALKSSQDHTLKIYAKHSIYNL